MPIHCVHCCDDLPSTHDQIVDGAYVCDTCYNECFECANCGALLHTSDMVCNDENNLYCPDCYDERFTRCEECNCEISSDEVYTYNDNQYCASCYNDNYCQCEGCSVVYPLETMVHNPNNCSQWYCPDCHESDCWDSGDDVIGHTFTELRSTRRYGIELEFSRCNDYMELQEKTCYGAKNDGTSGVEKEFVSPILQGDEGLNITRKFLHYADDNDFEVDKTCGYHLHIDCTNLTIPQLRAIAMAYQYTYKIWKYFVPESRRCNYYCREYTYKSNDILSMDFDDLIDLPESRYIWANWEAYKRHHTLEIRLHTGSTDETKIINWVKAHLRFVDYVLGYTALELHNLLQDADKDELFKFMADTWNDDVLTSFYFKRANKFGGRLHYENISDSDDCSDILCSSPIN